jgi:topoisomerase IA-like protein
MIEFVLVFMMGVRVIDQTQTFQDLDRCLYFAEKNLKKKKSKGVGGADLEEFMALEQIREKEEELKKMMIYLGRPGLWQDWQRFQAEARKSRRYQEKMAEKRRQELIEYAGYGIGFIILLFFAGVLAWFAGKWTGKF